MNFFYVENGKFVTGYTDFKSAEELSMVIPKGCNFYFYNIGDDLLSIISSRHPAGTGIGKTIDISDINH